MVKWCECHAVVSMKWLTQVIGCILSVHVCLTVGIVDERWPSWAMRCGHWRTETRPGHSLRQTVFGRIHWRGYSVLTYEDFFSERSFYGSFTVYCFFFRKQISSAWLCFCAFWHCSHRMQSRVYVTLVRQSVSVCPSVPSFGRRTPLLLVRWCGPGIQEISIDCCTAVIV